MTSSFERVKEVLNESSSHVTDVRHTCSPARCKSRRIVAESSEGKLLLELANYSTDVIHVA